MSGKCYSIQKTASLFTYVYVGHKVLPCRFKTSLRDYTFCHVALYVDLPKDFSSYKLILQLATSICGPAIFISCLYTLALLKSSIVPTCGYFLTGDKVDIKLEVYVGKRTAGSLTSGKTRLNDILILHLRGGRDIFVTVR